VNKEQMETSVLNAPQDTTSSTVLAILDVLKDMFLMTTMPVLHKDPNVMSTIVMNVKKLTKVFAEHAKKELSYLKENVLTDVLKDTELTEFHGLVWKPLSLPGTGFTLPQPLAVLTAEP